MVCARDVWARSLRIDGEHVTHDQLVAPDHIRVEEAGRDAPIMHHERDLWCGRGLPEERSDGLAKAATDLRQIVALWSEASFFPVILRHAPDADKAANFGEACGERCKRGVVARESGAEKHRMGRVTWSGDPDRPRVGQIEQVVDFPKTGEFYFLCSVNRCGDPAAIRFPLGPATYQAPYPPRRFAVTATITKRSKSRSTLPRRATLPR